jgi:hypothetical protein
MLALHNWPKPAKRLLLTGAIVLVALAYVSLCLVAWLLASVVFSP